MNKAKEKQKTDYASLGERGTGGSGKFYILPCIYIENFLFISAFCGWGKGRKGRKRKGCIVGGLKKKKLDRFGY